MKVLGFSVHLSLRVAALAWIASVGEALPRSFPAEKTAVGVGTENLGACMKGEALVQLSGGSTTGVLACWGDG